MPSIGESLSVAYNPETDIMNKVYLKQAYLHALKYSNDPSTQNGAVLVHSSGGIIIGASNGISSKLENKPERWERPQKYDYVEHAERNVIYKSAQKGIATNGLFMFCPFFSCPDCARAIIHSGISKVVGHKQFFNLADDRWREPVKTGIEMLREAGIICVLWDGDVSDGTITIKVNGKDFVP